MMILRMLCSVMAAGFFATGVGLAPARGAVFNPETFTLNNGMQVVVVTNHRAPVVSHMVWYKVGAADEPEGKSGLAHFFEHLMFKGTPRWPDGEFSREVARNGGQENAFTSQDYTGYFQNVAVDRLPIVMEMEADRMTNLVLTPETVEPERKVILEERRARVGNSPGARLSEQLSAAMYLNHPYGDPVIGWAHEITALSLDDITGFYQRWYAPNNAILVVSGDITAEQLKPLAEKYYGVIPARPVPPRTRASEPPHDGERRVILRDARVRQPSWQRAYLAPSLTAGETGSVAALEVLEQVLGGNATSRFYRTLVVEAQLAVSAGASYRSDALDMTSFTIYASPRPGTDMAKLEAAVLAEVRHVLEDGITLEEVARAKQQMIDSAVFARDSYKTPARVLGAALASGKTVAVVENWPDRIGAVTVDQVNAAARALFVNAASVTGLLLAPINGAEAGK